MLSFLRKDAAAKVAPREHVKVALMLPRPFPRLLTSEKMRVSQKRKEKREREREREMCVRCVRLLNLCVCEFWLKLIF